MNHNLKKFIGLLVESGQIERVRSEKKKDHRWGWFLLGLIVGIAATVLVAAIANGVVP